MTQLDELDQQAAVFEGFQVKEDLAQQFKGQHPVPNYWGKVACHARDGAPDALSAVGHTGEITDHPVCRDVLTAISVSGTPGGDLQKQFSGPPYGWPKDAINGAVMTLVAAKHILAVQDGTALALAKQLEPRKVGTRTFRKEDEPPTASQRMVVRGLLTTAKIPYDNGQGEAQLSALLEKLRDLAEQVGGPPPLPAPPDTSLVDHLGGLAGNEQFPAIADEQWQLKADLEAWSAAAHRRDAGQREWDTFEALLHHARDLDGVDDLQSQRDGVLEGRLLLEDPNPIRPILETVAALLAEHLTGAAAQLRDDHREVIAELESSDEWQQLDVQAWEEIVEKAGLQGPPQVDVSTREKLLDVLNDATLESSKDRTEVLRARAKRAREAAAKRLEPAAVTISLDGAHPQERGRRRRVPGDPARADPRRSSQRPHRHHLDATRGHDAGTFDRAPTHP